jgi:hypothetical protein
VAEFPVVRLGEEDEASIAEMAVAVTQAHAAADSLESAMAEEAGRLVDRLIVGSGGGD